MNSVETNPPVPGLLSAVLPGQLYLFDHGYVFAGTWHHEEPTSRFAAAVILSLDGQEFGVGVPDAELSTQAIAFRPFVKRSLSSRKAPLLAVGISPSHGCYRAFRELGTDGILSLGREAFAGLNHRMWAAYEGRLTGREAQNLCQAVCETVALQLPPLEPLDPRVQRVLDMLELRPNFSLDELSKAIDLSYDRLSHLFSDAMGLPLRSYALSQKIHRASQLIGRGMTLTEIAMTAGFADSAHFSRVWVKTFGASPSAFFNNPSVRVQNTISDPRVVAQPGL